MGPMLPMALFSLEKRVMGPQCLAALLPNNMETQSVPLRGTDRVTTVTVPVCSFYNRSNPPSYSWL